MIFKRKKSSADKAFELCVDLLAEIRKQEGALNGLTEKVNSFDRSLAEIMARLERYGTESGSAQTRLYLCVKETQENVCEVGRMITDLKNGVMAYEQKKEDAVTVAQILDEYLNGGKEEQ
ncbi:MAG: hypothetical protein IKB51_03985 [Clostridia bacterium]|nr:hypothetical protein [Clostridia bacterium]